jgi:hypothetical protein
MLKGTREVTEGAFPHGVKDVPRCELISKNDETRVRANRSDSVNDLKIVRALVLRSYNDQVERTGRGREEGRAIVGNMLNAPAVAYKNAFEQCIDLSSGINDKCDSLGNRRRNGRCTAARCHGASKESAVSDKADILAQGESWRCEITSRAEAIQSVGLMLKARNDI